MRTYNAPDLITTSETEPTTQQLPSFADVMAELLPVPTTNPDEPFAVYCHISLPKLPAGELQYFTSRRLASFATIREAVGTAKLYKRVAAEHGWSNLSYEVLVNAAMLEDQDA